MRVFKVFFFKKKTLNTFIFPEIPENKGIQKRCVFLKENKRKAPKKQKAPKNKRKAPKTE